MFIRPTTLALILTYRCTASCDHCCFHCSPRVTGTIPFRRALSLIDEAADLGSIVSIVFTGGEAFLLGTRLAELISRARKRGFLTRCVSNGYWAKSESLARERIERLREAGLNELNLSTGPFHAAHVPVERVIHAACAASDAGLITLVTVETFVGSGISPETLLADPRVAERSASGRLIIRRNVWMPNGGCCELEHSPEQQRFRPANRSGCETVLNVIGVTPELQLLACCGLRATLIPELALGNLTRKPLGEVLDSAPDDLLKMWLQVEGPERILEFLADRDSSIQLPTDAVHPCQSCEYLFSNRAVRQLLVEHYLEAEPVVIERFMTSLAVVEVQRKIMRASAGALSNNQGPEVGP